MLEGCGSYLEATRRCAFWASVVCDLGLQGQYGVEIKLAPGAGWSVFLGRHDNTPVPSGVSAEFEVRRDG